MRKSNAENSELLAFSNFVETSKQVFNQQPLAKYLEQDRKI